MKLKVLRGDDIEPTQSSNEANEIAQRDPWLRSERRWKLNSEVIYKCRTPLWLEKPAGWQKRDCRGDKESEKNEVRERAERKPWRLNQQVNFASAKVNCDGMRIAFRFDNHAAQLTYHLYHCSQRI